VSKIWYTNGKRKVMQGPDLKGTQVYPIGFGAAIACNMDTCVDDIVYATVDGEPPLCLDFSAHSVHDDYADAITRVMVHPASCYGWLRFAGCCFFLSSCCCVTWLLMITYVLLQFILVLMYVRGANCCCLSLFTAAWS